jgi:hypothetical protein
MNDKLLIISAAAKSFSCIESVQSAQFLTTIMRSPRYGQENVRSSPYQPRPSSSQSFSAAMVTHFMVDQYSWRCTQRAVQVLLYYLL